MKYDVILWDVDGTLLDFEYSERYSLVKCLEEIGVKATEEIITRYSEINIGWWKRLEKGEVTKAELLHGRFYDLVSEFQIDCEDILSLRLRYQEYLGSVYKYMDDSISICKRLQGKVKQYVVTNGVTHTQENKLKLSGFDKVMDGCFISEQMGVPKPHREFFDKVFESMPEISKERILIVGDSLTSDIEGGIRAGIDTCWYNPEHAENDGTVNMTYTIQQLDEIFGILEG